MSDSDTESKEEEQARPQRRSRRRILAELSDSDSSGEESSERPPKRYRQQDEEVLARPPSSHGRRSTQARGQVRPRDDSQGRDQRRHSSDEEVVARPLSSHGRRSTQARVRNSRSQQPKRREKHYEGISKPNSAHSTGSDRGDRLLLRHKKKEVSEKLSAKDEEIKELQIQVKYLAADKERLEKHHTEDKERDEKEPQVRVIKSQERA